MNVYKQLTRGLNSHFHMKCVIGDKVSYAAENRE